MSDDRKVFEFKGRDITVAWDGRLCIHVQECTRAGGELFVSGRSPWCVPDGGEADEVAEVARRCPTGALTYGQPGGDGGEVPPAENTVQVSNNGPLYVRGDLVIDGAAPDMPGVRYRAALCRCGASAQKPFCDNSHEKTGFVDRGAVCSKGTRGTREPVTAAQGALEIKRAENGPLLLYGRVTIVTAAGRVAWRGDKAALCRCGASKNKPFCDGAHASAGFQAE